MENRIEKALQLLKSKTYLATMGANTVAKRYGYTAKEIVEAKKLFYSRERENKKPGFPKILIFDIETAPMTAYVWKRWKENISLDQTISEWFIICWSAKWLGEDGVLGECLTPEEIVAEDDKRITEALWKVLDEADIVIAHNGKNFDIPKANSRFIIHGLPPCSPYRQIDTCESSKKVFGFSSNKLDALATYFGVPNKDETDFDLWKRCLKGEREALDYMFRYNKNDTLILEKVYLRMRPWIPGHPNANLYYEGNSPICPVCGSTHIIETNSSLYTSVSKFKVFRCEDCGALSRGRINTYSKDRKKLVSSI